MARLLLAAWPFLALPAAGQEVLRGEIRVDLEPVQGFYMDEQYPLDLETARRRGINEAAMVYGGMIYGWSFHYDIGERARGIPEKLELTPLGIIPHDDPRIEITDIQIKELRLYLWSDYRLHSAQIGRIAKWRAGTVRSIQGYGHGPLGLQRPEDIEEAAPGPGLPPSPADRAWLEIRKTALEDAARAALRGMLRGLERNRPKEVTGYISLAAFPRFWLDKGQWAAQGRFYTEITEIIPFSAY